MNGVMNVREKKMEKMFTNIDWKFFVGLGTPEEDNFPLLNGIKGVT